MDILSVIARCAQSIDAKLDGISSIGGSGGSDGGSDKVILTVREEDAVFDEDEHFAFVPISKETAEQLYAAYPNCAILYPFNVDGVEAPCMENIVFAARSGDDYVFDCGNNTWLVTEGSRKSPEDFLGGSRFPTHGELNGAFSEVYSYIYEQRDRIDSRIDDIINSGGIGGSGATVTMRFWQESDFGGGGEI